MSTNVRITQTVLLVVGLATWVVIAGILKKGGDLDYQPNLLHLKGSPYGRTLALAMRGPADVFWHRGEVHDHDSEGCEEEGCDHDHSGCDHEQGECDHEGCDHADEAEGSPAAGDADLELAAMVDRLSEEDAGHEGCDHEGCGEGDDEAEHPPAEFTGVRPFLLDTIAGMRAARHSRNNDRGETRLHRAFVMAETEKRLALSFQMDPTNIACYGSYFMFLAEALARVEGAEGEATVIRERRNAAMDLAEYTFGYCLNYQDEAPAMVTGAVAAHDYVQFRMSSPDPDIEELGEVLRILDSCIGRYEAIRAQMIEDGTWENFFIHRREEMEKAYSLVRVLRNVDHTVFQRLQGSSVALPKPTSGAGVAGR